MGAMARRGDELRDHILQAAKQVFLEMGFERASMDEVARRAETSKRSLYAHYESKEKLLLAVVEYVRELHLTRLEEPATYAEDPVDALTMFCARYVENTIYRQQSVQLMRLLTSETARFPEGAARHYDAIFNVPTARVAAYLKTRFGLSPRASEGAAQRLFGAVLYPRLVRALFGLEELLETLDPRNVSPKVDVRGIRRAVTELIESIEKER